MEYELTELQYKFYQAKEDEVLFGGAAGGGKSYGQVIDALLYASDYPGIKQLILRRTYPELEKSLIRTTRDKYPKAICGYNESKKTYTFKNGSLIDFGYCNSEKDVYQYQSAEYDVIRLDEATHFTGFMYLYLKSRIRGVNNYPKQMKSTTNPGNVGHLFFKERFVDNGTEVFEDENGKRIFIPAKLKDNKFLMKNDPDYAKRLESLPEKEKKALRDGNWDIFDGQFFPEFDRSIHVIEPFVIPEHWNRYIALDYGLDMFAVLFFTIDTKGKAYVYNEIHKSNLIVSEARQVLKSIMRHYKYRCIYAPPDLWNRNRDTGKSTAEMFNEGGITFTRAGNNRVSGWLAVKEWLRICKRRHEQTGELYEDSDLKIFNNCINLIRCLPQLQHDEKNPNDVAIEPHEITHITDALRYFCVSRVAPSKEPDIVKDVFNFKSEEPVGYDYGEEIIVV